MGILLGEGDHQRSCLARDWGTANALLIIMLQTRASKTHTAFIQTPRGNTSFYYMESWGPENLFYILFALILGHGWSFCPIFMTEKKVQNFISGSFLKPYTYIPSIKVNVMFQDKVLCKPQNATGTLFTTYPRALEQNTECDCGNAFYLRLQGQRNNNHVAKIQLLLWPR